MSSPLSESGSGVNQVVNLTGPGPAVAVVQLVSKLSVKDNLSESVMQLHLDCLLH